MRGERVRCQAADGHAGWTDLGIARLATEDNGGVQSLSTDGPPFVLLDDARSNGCGLLYRSPEDIITTCVPEDVTEALKRVRAAVARGLNAVGYLSYEAGIALEPKLAHLVQEASPEEPLLWFGLFRDPIRIPNIPDILPPPLYLPSSPQPEWSADRYQYAVAAALDLISAGDIYQANITFPAAVAFPGPPLAHYAHLRRAQSAGWGGLVFTGRHWLLSCSPELFFTLEDRRLLAKPMKGTAMRGSTSDDDLAALEWLRSSSKDRAENLMIVDLLRNDVGRVAVPGSVCVPKLFDVETYPTLHQMTSSVRAQLRPNLDAADVIASTFPCGSITGAPKIRAMEVIAALEGRRRQAYTGSIGVFARNGDAAFNVAIRTVEHRAGSGLARICVGSGLVADSIAESEWAECQAKFAFVRSFDKTTIQTDFQSV